MYKKIQFNRSIKSLTITMGDIEIIPPLYGLTSLTYINLSCNKITTIKNLNYHNNITHLNLRNLIRKIQNLQFLKKLTHLNLAVNFIRNLEGLEQLQKSYLLQPNRKLINENRTSRISHKPKRTRHVPLSNHENWKYKDLNKS